MTQQKKYRNGAFRLVKPETFTISCQSEKESRDFAKHEITVFPDWTVETPHDLDAERVAAAFGGWISCLQLGSGITAARHGMALQMRRARHPLHHSGRGRWAVEGRRRARTFPSVISAATHVRSPNYLAQRYGALDWQVQRIMACFRWTLDDHVAAPPPASAARYRDHVLEPDGLNRLWDAGLRPEDVLIAEQWVGISLLRPLSAASYIEILYSGVKKQQFREMLALVDGDLDSVIGHLGDGVRGAAQLSKKLNSLPGGKP